MLKLLIFNTFFSEVFKSVLMNKHFFEEIYKYPDIKKEDYDRIANAHSSVEFSKNDLLIKAGKVSNAYFLVEKGLFRSYVIDFKGNEITTGFFSNNHILIEVASLFLRQPSQENFQALTNGVAWKIDIADFHELFQTIDGFSEWGRAWMSNQLFISKQNSINMLTQSATDRYLHLVKAQPEVIKNAPLKFIASFLGITDTSLSRIRKEIATKA